MDPKQFAAVVQVQMGLQLCLSHVFTCLHHKGVISLDEAAQSFEATEQALPTDVPPATRLIVSQMARTLHMLAAQQSPPNPNGPPPATRPDLKVIQGGKMD